MRADHRGALTHTGQSKVSLGDEASQVGAAGDASPVIGDGHAQPIMVLGETHGDFRRIGVLNGIMQRFLGKAIDGQRCLRSG